MTSPLASLIKSGADVLDSGDKFNIDRSKYLNASSADTCIRRQWFERKFPEIAADQDWGYARRGSHGEMYVVDCLEAITGATWGMAEEQSSLVSEEHRISATPDGWIMLPGSDDIVQVEIKTIDPRTYASNLPREPHITQLEIAMEIAHENTDVLMEAWGLEPPAYGILIYMDASNYNLFHEFKVDRNPGILERYSKRAARMLDARKVDRLDREGMRTGECKKYDGCPFAERCGVGKLEAKPATVTRGNKGSKLEAALTAYVRAKDEAGEAKKVMDDNKETIVQEMQARGVRSLPVGNRQIVLTERAGSRTYDWKAAEQAGRDDGPFTKVGKASVSLSVK